MLGVDHRQFVGKTIEEAFPALLLTDVPEAYRTVAASGLPYNAEQVDYDENGIRGAFEVHAFQTAPQRMAVFFRDISERKKAETALRDSEKKMQSIFRAAPTGIGVVVDRVFTEVNHRVCAITGYSRDELLGRSARMVYPSDAEFEAVGRIKYGQIAKDGIGTVETRWKRKDGTVIDVLLSSAPIDPADLSRGVTFTVLDITERKRAALAERAVYEIARATDATDNLEDLYSSIHAIIKGLMPAKNFYVALVDEEKGLLSFPYYVDEFDSSPPPHQLGRGLTEYVLRTGRSLLCDAAVDEELTNRGEVEMIGTPAACWLGAPLITGVKTIGIVGLQHYSDPKSYGEREKDILDFVSGQVAKAIERKRTEEALQASCREKEILLREIHHRVKNNMQIVSSLLHLQSDRVTDEESRRTLKEGQLRIRSMALVHEKLYQSPDLSAIDFADYLRSLLTHLFRFFHIDAERIRLETALDHVLLDINAAVPCGLLASELITNALKHAFPMDRKGVVEVGLHRTDDGAVALRIADNGVGIPESRDVFGDESFGLQIVNLLVGQIDGTVELDRKKGTSFTITFRGSKAKAGSLDILKSGN
jgi:PAS domain S-box-containing protein